jgi:radical SAM superfamily enzyme YgiQ (UPF0313 family)
MTNKVLTINLPYTVPNAIPYGPAVINGVLKAHGYETSTWDLSIDLHNHFQHDPEFEKFRNIMTVGWAGNFEKLPTAFVKKIIKFIKQQTKHKTQQYNPDILALSVFSSHCVDLVPLVVTVLRELLPQCYIIVGGRGLDNIEKQSGLNYGEYFVKYLPIDCAYLGDGENQLIATVNDRVHGVVYADPVNKEELVTVPPADWTGFNFDSYVGYATQDLRMPITASKGCVRQCTFCDVATSWPKYIFRDGTSVGEEMINIYHRTGMHKFEFTDNLVNGSISNFRAMNTVIAEKLPNTLDYLGFAICRPKKENPESDFELARLAGAKRLRIGIESGSEKVRFDVGKKFSNDDVDWFTTNCAKNNIHQTWLMFVGYPTETEEDFQESLRLLKYYSPLARAGHISTWMSLPMMLTNGGNIMQHHNDAVKLGLEHNYTDQWAVNFWTSSIYKDNTFKIRADRWRRLFFAAQDLGYMSVDRQKEKLLELEGLEKLYENYNTSRKTIPIIPASTVLFHPS